MQRGTPCCLIFKARGESKYLFNYYYSPKIALIIVKIYEEKSQRKE